MPNSQSRHSTEMGGERAESMEPSWREQSQMSMHEGMEYLRQGCSGITETMSRHPMATALMGFGVGIGVGLLLGTTMGRATREHHWYDVDLDFDTERVERFGRKVLDAVADALPESVSRRLVG